jgi:hypothetical protein
MPERPRLSLAARLSGRSWAAQLGGGMADRPGEGSGPSADIRAQLDTGGKGWSKTVTSAGPSGSVNFRVGELKFDPPRCEQCRAPFTSDRQDLSQYPRWSPKRFCSETCRKRAESARARRRKLEPDDAA